VGERLRDRRCVVTVDTLRIEGLRCSFKAQKTGGKEPNTLELIITNLSEDSRARMPTRGAQVTVQAGYAENVALIFAGDARSIEHTWEGTEVTTKVLCGDGERAFQYARANQSFGPGARPEEIVRHLVGELKVNPGNAFAKLKQYSAPFDEYAQGFTAYGKASAELDRVMKALGLTWSVQDGELQVLEPGEANKAEAVLLSVDTGLVGTPTFGTSEKKGGPAMLKARSLLQPRIKPGTRIVMKGAQIKGVFRTIAATHTGDTAGSDWYTDLEGMPE